MVWLKGGCYFFVLFSAILGIWIFLVRLKGGAIFCYFGVVGHTNQPFFKTTYFANHPIYQQRLLFRSQNFQLKCCFENWVNYTKKKRKQAARYANHHPPLRDAGRELSTGVFYIVNHTVFF